MNVKNNKRRKDSIEKIEKAFIGLLQERELHKISVTDICKKTGLNRSTFYANFLDVYDLADKMRDKLEEEFNLIFKDNTQIENDSIGAVRFFSHIKENQLLYKTYFKLGYDSRHRPFVFDTLRAEQDFNNRHLEYHIEFFRSGLNAIIKMWLDGGCVQSPEEMAEIIKSEYQGR